MSVCINVQQKQFKDFFKSYYPKEDFDPSSPLVKTLASKIETWREQTGNDGYPNVLELKERNFRQSISNIFTLEKESSFLPDSLVLPNVPNEFIGNESYFTDQAIKTFNTFFFTFLFRDPQNVTNLFSEGDNAVYTETVAQVQDQIKKMYDLATEQVVKAKESGNNKVLEKALRYQNNYYHLLTNLEQIVDLHRFELQKYNLDIIDNDAVQNEFDNDSAELWATESLKYSSKQKATSNTRLLIGTLKDTDRNIFGTSVLVDFGKMFNLLANRLSNLKNTGELMENLKQLNSVEPAIDQLVEKLVGENGAKKVQDYTLADVMRVLEFAQAFSKHYNQYDFAFVGENGQFNIVDAVINTAQKRMMDEWAANQVEIADKTAGFDSSASSMFVQKDGAFEYNTGFFKRNLPQSLYRAAIVNKHELFSLSPEEINDIQTELGVKSLTAAELKYHTYVKFLNLLGANIESNKLPSQPDKFYNGIDSIIKTIREGDTGLIYGKSGNVKNYLTPVIEHVVETTPDFVENQFLNFANETQYNVQLNSYLTLIEDKIRNSRSLEQVFEELPHLNNVFSKSSKTLQMIIDGKLDLKMSFFEGLKNEITQEATQFSKLSHTDKIIFNINSALEGHHPFFRAGDNSLERTFGVMYYNPKLDANTVQSEFIKDAVDAFENEILYFKSIFSDSQKYNKATLDNPVEDSIFSDIIKSAKVEQQFIDAVTSDTKLSSQTVSKIEQAIKREFEAQRENLKDYIAKKEIVSKESFKNKDGETEYRYISRGLSAATQSQASVFSEQAINSVLTKILANRTMWNFEQTKLFTGHPMYYGNADNFFKRMSAAVGTKKKSIADEFTLPLVEKHFPRKNSERIVSKGRVITRTAVFEDIMTVSSTMNYLKKQKAFKGFDDSAYKEMNEADAISYFSLDFYRDIRIFNGDWTNADERLYQWLNRDGAKSIEYTNFNGTTETISNESQLVNANGKRTVFNMLKPQYFGPLAEKGFIPSMYKTGAVPILPNVDMKQFPNVAKIQKLMKDKNIDVVTFESANKVGTKLNDNNEIQKLFTLKQENEGYVGYIDSDFLSDNIVTQDTYMDYWGIQLDTGNAIKDKVVKGSQFMKLITSNLFDNGKAISPQASRLVNRFQKIHEQLVKQGVEELKTEFGLVEEDGQYNPVAVDRVIDTLLRETSKRNANNNVLTSVHMLKKYIDRGLGINILSNRDKIENILMAIADSRIFSQKINGGGFIQMPSTLFEQSVDGQGYKYTDDKLNYLSNNSVRLLEDGTMEVMLPYRYKGKYKIEDFSDDALKLVGFRIPTSGLNSIEKIKVTGFLPAEYGDTVLLPSDIVAKAGSDYDIDKLQIFIPNVKKEGKRLVAEKYDAKRENTREQLENGLIETAWEILDLASNLPQHLESIGTTSIKSERNRVVDARKVSQQQLSFTKMLFDMTAYNEITQRNITSKQLTGIAALHVTDHQNSIRHGYYVTDSWMFEEGSYNVREDGVSFGSMKTVDGKNISSNLNEGLNASVDGAKDPLFFDLNISLDNANDIFTLMRSGMSLRNIMTLLNQPIIRDYVELKSLKRSLINQGEQEFLTDTTITTRLTEKYGSDINPNVITFAEMESTLDEKAALKNAVSKAKQRKILEAYKAVERTSEKLNNYMQSTRIDTEAGGKNSSEFDLRLFHANRVANKESGIINAEKIFDDGGFLNPYFNALKSIEEIYTPYFFHKISAEKYSEFNDVYNDMVEKLAMNQYISNDTKVRILDNFKTDYISAHLLQKELTFNGINYGKISDKIEQLISGPNSVAKRGKKLKASGIKNNLLESLHFVLSSETITLAGKKIRPDHVKLYDQRLDALEANMLIEGFRELFANPETRDFAADLAALTIAQSGLQNSPLTYTKLIPSEIYMEMVDSALNDDFTLNMDWFETSFYFNNGHITDLVKTIYRPAQAKKFPISKLYSYLPEYSKLDDAGKKEWRAKGKAFKNPIPTYYINLNHRATPESFKRVFGDANTTMVKHRSNGYRDLSKNKMLSSYWSKQNLPDSEVGDYPLTKELQERLDNIDKVAEKLKAVELGEVQINENHKCFSDPNVKTFG